MDFFGIGAAIKGAISVYFHHARGTGRTTSMINALRDGDRVYFATAREAQQFERTCKQRNKKIECVVIPPKEPTKVFERAPAKGRSIFDHSWIQEYYRHGFDCMEKEIRHFEVETSGYGEEHEKTKLKAQEICKWASIPNI